MTRKQKIIHEKKQADNLMELADQKINEIMAALQENAATKYVVQPSPPRKKRRNISIKTDSKI